MAHADLLATWEQAGLYDPAAQHAPDRLALLEYLHAEGFGLDDMLEADAHGRLFALAGDRIAGTGKPVHSVADAAARFGVAPAFVQRVWRAWGLPALGDGPVLSDADVEALAVQFLAAPVLGEDNVVALSRVAGTAMARLVEAEATAMRVAVGDTDLGVSESEVATAVAWAGVANLVPGIGRVLDVVHRHHIGATRNFFESLDMQPQQPSVVVGVGFADLSGFTALSSTAELTDLSRLLAAFEAEATDGIHRRGGRVVKFLGDAVMWVAPTAVQLAQIAQAIVSHPGATEAGLAFRAGIAWGQTLVQDGDYFGPPVNLAARLVAVAAPGEVLADPVLAEALAAASIPFEPSEARRLRGIESEVTPLRVGTPATGY
ncbi:MAG TPA: adenylate cyclase regulatory domain-containing protein [Mycobacteriales bacterium]|nr:adenylate cyclase regulatory domain-containing protein [Mycobacteriales bacterium]